MRNYVCRGFLNAVPIMEFDDVKFDTLSPGAKQLLRAIQSEQKEAQGNNFATIIGSDKTIRLGDVMRLIHELMTKGFLIHRKHMQWQIPEELRNKSAFTG